jgi:hypothetical protein
MKWLSFCDSPVSQRGAFSPGRPDSFSLPNKVSAIIGVNLRERNHGEKMRQIERIPTVTGVWNATGRFDLFIDVMVDSLQHPHEFHFERHLKQIGVMGRLTDMALKV